MPGATAVTPPANTLTSKFQSPTGSSYRGINALLKIPTVAPSTGTSASSGTTPYTAFAKASASTGESASVGNGVTLGIGAQAAASASATPVSVKAAAGASVNDGITLNPAAGVTIGVQETAGVNAAADVGIGAGNLHATASVSVGAEVGASVDYTKQFSNGGSVNVDGSTTVGVVATGTGTAQVGKILLPDGSSAFGASLSGKAYAGSVVSVSGDASYTNSGFEAGGGATAIAAGSVGGSAGASPTYSDGSVGINVNLVADVGIGGVGLSFSAGIPVSEFSTLYSGNLGFGSTESTVLTSTLIAATAINPLLGLTVFGVEEGIIPNIGAIDSGLKTAGNAIANTAESLAGSAKNFFVNDVGSGLESIGNHIASIF